jgi:hypothetical protein
MSNLSRSVVLLAVCLLGFVSGCGSDGGRRAVSGSVTFNGRPLAQGAITFFSSTGDPPGPIGGAMIQGGRFDVAAEHGLEPGTYRVEISAPAPSGELTPEERAVGASPRGKETVPAEFNTQSTLTVEVGAWGSNHFEIAIP